MSIIEHEAPLSINIETGCSCFRPARYQRDLLPISRTHLSLGKLPVETSATYAHSINTMTALNVKGLQILHLVELKQFDILKKNFLAPQISITFILHTTLQEAPKLLIFITTTIPTTIIPRYIILFPSSPKGSWGQTSYLPPCSPNIFPGLFQLQ